MAEAGTVRGSLPGGRSCWAGLALLGLFLGGCGSVQFGWEIEGQRSLGTVPPTEVERAEGWAAETAPARNRDRGWEGRSGPEAVSARPIGRVLWVNPEGDFAVVQLTRPFEAEGPVFLLGMGSPPEGKTGAVFLTRGGTIGRSLGAEVLEGEAHPRRAVRLPGPAEVEALAERYRSGPGRRDSRVDAPAGTS